MIVRIACFGLMILLTACEPVILAGTSYAVVKNSKPEEEKPRQVPETFCYRTLSHTNCYTMPQEEQEYRFTGPYSYPHTQEREKEPHWSERDPWDLFTSTFIYND